MITFTVEDLKKIMLSTADTGTELDVDFLDRTLTDLDFDSLSKLEMVTRIQQDYHLAIPDEVVDELQTPRAVLDYVTGRLHQTT